MQATVGSTVEGATKPLPPLWTKGFIALMVAQFLGALNDNIFRWLIIPIGKCAVGWSDRPDAIRMIGSLAFLIPFLIFTTYAGYVSDRFDRRKVLIGSKAAELIVMLLSIWAILSQSVPFMLVTLFLMATQSAFFSPAKYGSLPNLVSKERISEANGYITMTTMVACIGGQVLGSLLFVWTTLSYKKPVEGTGGMHNWYIWALVLVGASLVGWIASLFIDKIPAADPKAKFPINPFSQTYRDLRFLFQKRYLFWIAMTSSFFWGLGALAQVNVDKFATEYLSVHQGYVPILLTSLSLGLAIGAALAGRLSKGTVKLHLVPIGASLIVVCCFILSFTPRVVLSEGSVVASPLTFSFIFGACVLFAMGIPAGMNEVPLLTTLQLKSPPENRGRILAAYNFFSFVAMILFSICQGWLASPPGSLKTIAHGLNAGQIWLFCAFITMPMIFLTYRAFCRKTSTEENE